MVEEHALGVDGCVVTGAGVEEELMRSHSLSQLTPQHIGMLPPQLLTLLLFYLFKYQNSQLNQDMKVNLHFSHFSVL